MQHVVYNAYPSLVLDLILDDYVPPVITGQHLRLRPLKKGPPGLGNMEERKLWGDRAMLVT